MNVVDMRVGRIRVIFYGKNFEEKKSRPLNMY